MSESVGYKLVYCDMGDMISYIMCGPFSVKRYLTNKWVFPNENCGALCVFDTEENARKFQNDMKDIYGRYEYNSKLFRCLYVPTYMDVFSPSWNNIREIEHLNTIPEGTVKASAVKLLEEIEL